MLDAIVVSFIWLMYSGCATVPHGSLLKLRGHWTEGAAFSYFTLTDNKETYMMADKTLPTDAINLLESQPLHRDPFHGDFTKCHSAYLEILGTINNEEFDGNRRYKVLSVRKVLAMGPAHKTFLDLKHPPLPLASDN
jgi:hypothetical protein